MAGHWLSAQKARCLVTAAIVLATCASESFDYDSEPGVSSFDEGSFDEDTQESLVSEMKVALIQENMRLQKVSQSAASIAVPETAASLVLKLGQTEAQTTFHWKLSIGVCVVTVTCTMLLAMLVSASRPGGKGETSDGPQVSGSSGQAQSKDREAPDAEMLEFMARVPAFRNISRSELPDLAACFTTRVAQPGEVIVTQGDRGHELFFIRSGSVVAKVQEAGAVAGSEKELGVLSAGAHFGEGALLTEAPRNATVYALENVTLSVLTREEFQKRGLQNKMALELKQAQMSSSLFLALTSAASLRSLARLFLVLLAYVLVTGWAFSKLEGWAWSDCIYFSMVTLSTVGYGDFAPKTVPGRLMFICIVIVALLFVARAIGDFLQHLVSIEIELEKARKTFLLSEPCAVSIFDKKGQREQWRRQLYMCLLGMFVLFSLATLTSSLMLDGVKNWADAMYFSLVTLTTIGYGDITPQTQSCKWFVSFLCLFGVPVFGMLFARVVEIAYGEARSSQMQTATGTMTAEDLIEVQEFRGTMQKAGVHFSQEDLDKNQIKPFDFLCFILTQNETIDIDGIKAIMDNFKDLDKDGSGYLNATDLGK